MNTYGVRNDDLAASSPYRRILHSMGTMLTECGLEDLDGINDFDGIKRIEDRNASDDFDVRDDRNVSDDCNEHNDCHVSDERNDCNGNDDSDDSHEIATESLALGQKNPASAEADAGEYAGETEMGLTETGARLLDAAHGLDDVIIARGVAHAETLGAAESVAADGGNVGHFEEIEGEISGRLDDALTIRLAEIGRNLGEEIEGASRIIDLETRNLTGEADDEVLTAEESLTHIFDALLIGSESLGGGNLAD